MLEKAKELASQEFSRLSGREIKAEDCYVVWFSKTLQNWKALVGTNQIKSGEKCGDYAEVTHNGDKAETYVDVYVKVSNRAIKDQEAVRILTDKKKQYHSNESKKKYQSR